MDVLGGDQPRHRYDLGTSSQGLVLVPTGSVVLKFRIDAQGPECGNHQGWR